MGDDISTNLRVSLTFLQSINEVREIFVQKTAEKGRGEPTSQRRRFLSKPETHFSATSQNARRHSTVVPPVRLCCVWT
jgi:hypothetical protein